MACYGRPDERIYSFWFKTKCFHDFELIFSIIVKEFYLKVCFHLLVFLSLCHLVSLVTGHITHFSINRCHIRIYVVF